MYCNVSFNFFKKCEQYNKITVYDNEFKKVYDKTSEVDDYYAVGVYDSRKIIFSNDEYGDIIVTCTNTVGNGTRYEADVPYSLFVEDIEGNAVFT